MAKRKSKNPFTRALPYLLGFAFATVFFIMFFSSQITQNQIGSLDIDEIASEIEAEFSVVHK